jgi:hypothetical protein
LQIRVQLSVLGPVIQAVTVVGRYLGELQICGVLPDVDCAWCWHEVQTVAS